MKKIYLPSVKRYQRSASNPELSSYEVEPPDIRSSALKILLVLAVMVHSQIASAFDSGPVASVQDEAIVACYARYAKMAYLVDKRLKSIPDCDRRFSPNEPIPFRYVKTVGVANTPDFLEKGNNLDFYFRERTDDEHTKRQLLIAFRGTGSRIDLWTDIRTQTRLSKAIYKPQSNVAKHLKLSGVFGNHSGGPYEKAAFPAGFWDRGSKHRIDILDFVKPNEDWRDLDRDNRSLEIVITGHSLGASSSQVMGLWLMDRYETQRLDDGAKAKVEAFAFNPPKTANETTQKMVKNLLDDHADRYRMHLFINAVDPVSRIPGMTNKRYYHTVDHEDSVIASGTALEYKAVAWGKAAVNSVDLQKGFDDMEFLYTNGCYTDFPNWPNLSPDQAWWNPNRPLIPCARSAALTAHSLEQWFTSGWTDDSVPTYRRHLFPNLKGNQVASNTIDLAAQTSVSLFNDHQSALEEKRLVVGHKYRFQKAAMLDRCMVTDRVRNMASGHYCSFAGPRDFLFEAISSSTPDTVLLKSQSTELNKCLSTVSKNLETCDPENKSQQFEIVYDERSDEHRTPGAYSLKSKRDQCITSFFLGGDCPSLGQSGKWIVTEAPQFNEFDIPKQFQMLTEYNKELDCVYTSDSQILKLNKQPLVINPFDRYPSCHDKHLRLSNNKYEKELFSVERILDAWYSIQSDYHKLPVAPYQYPESGNYLIGEENPYLNLTKHYLARWFDGAYQFQSLRDPVDFTNMGLRLPHTATIEELEGKTTGHLGKVGSRYVSPAKNDNSVFAKSNQIHLRPLIDYDLHHAPQCIESSGDPSKGYDMTGNCSIKRRVEAIDDPHAASVSFGQIVDIDVLRNDSHVHAGPLDITDVSASRGTASINEDGTIRFQAPSDYFGRVSISYSISDGLPEMSDMPHGSDSAVATVHVVENVALNKPARQSSHWGYHPASRAVDGLMDNYTQTQIESKASWLVDLEGVHRVKEVNVFNREDCCRERLVNFNLILRHSNGQLSRFLSNEAHEQGVVKDVYSFGFWEWPFTDIVGVIVELEGTNYLNIAEVQVFGEKLGPPPPVSKQTNPDEDGGGNMVYLDRHKLSCGASGISQFQLKRQGGNKIYYGYECSQTASTDRQSQFTALSSDGGGDTRYLDRHAISCNNKPIKAFKLLRNNDHDEVRYLYKCGSQTLFGPTTNYTHWNTFSKSNWYLDRHNVECPSSQVLSFVRLETNWGSKKMRYKFICGSPFESPD